MQYHPKEERGKSYRASKRPKRHFLCNEYSSSIVNEDSGANTSSSSKKLATADGDDVICSLNHAYRIIEYFTVFTAISDLQICRKCKKDETFKETANRGLGFKIFLFVVVVII